MIHPRGQQRIGTISLQLITFAIKGRGIVCRPTGCEQKRKCSFLTASGRVGEGTPSPALTAHRCFQRQFTHKRYLLGLEMREFNGCDRLEKLKALADLLAEKMDEIKYVKDLAPLAKQYRETIKEIEEIEGADSKDDEIEELLQRRESNGAAGAVRPNRS